MKPIPYGKQEITDEDISEVVRVLKGDFLTQGPEIEKFEEEFSSYLGVKYAVAVANGTAALHLSALALGVDSKSRVITTPLTFAASANCIRYCGGDVHFADIDSETYLLDIKKVRSLLESHPVGTFDGIIPVDFAGRPTNLEQYRELADEYGMWILEDACHAPGGFFIDGNSTRQYCGNGHFADLAIFSFHPVKHIAAGEGGMITTNDEQLYHHLKRLRTHGITRDEDSYQNPLSLALGQQSTKSESFPGWYMEMLELGFNYRLTDIQAALGRSQLHRADQGLEKRRRIAENYYSAFKDCKGIKGQSGFVEGHAYHLYVIEVEQRLELYQYLRDHNIFAQIHYIPCHLMPYYQKLGWKHGDLPIVERYYSGCLSLPMYPALDENLQQYVIEKVLSFLK